MVRIAFEQPLGLPGRYTGLVARMSAVTDFGGSQEFTTWDGEPISHERPHGATIVVASRSPHGWRYLLLHRAHHGPDYDGDMGLDASERLT
jgi:hypothetical protein